MNWVRASVIAWTSFPAFYGTRAKWTACISVGAVLKSQGVYLSCGPAPGQWLNLEKYIVWTTWSLFQP